jgi:hypothetical protein
MSNQLFINNTDQETRRRVEHDSYLTRAQAEADQVGGRSGKKSQRQLTPFLSTRNCQQVLRGLQASIKTSSPSLAMT